MTSDQQRVLNDLPDDQVVKVLALMLEARSWLPDAATAQEIEQRLIAVAADPTSLQIIDDAAESSSTSAAEADPGQLPAGETAISDAALARVALDYLLTTDPDAAEVLPRAIRLATDDDAGTTRFDPLTLSVAGLVLAALQTEVDWTRSDTGRWKLRVHKRAMRDSTIATLIRGVLHLGAPDSEGQSSHQ